MEDLVGQPGGGLVVPGYEGALGRVPAHRVRAGDELSPALQEQEGQGLLDAGAVHLHRLNHNGTKASAKDTPVIPQNALWRMGFI